MNSGGAKKKIGPMGAFPVTHGAFLMTCAFIVFTRTNKLTNALPYVCILQSICFSFLSAQPTLWEFFFNQL